MSATASCEARPGQTEDSSGSLTESNIEDADVVFIQSCLFVLWRMEATNIDETL